MTDLVTTYIEKTKIKIADFIHEILVHEANAVAKDAKIEELESYVKSLEDKVEAFVTGAKDKFAAEVKSVETDVVDVVHAAESTVKKWYEGNTATTAASVPATVVSNTIAPVVTAVPGTISVTNDPLANYA
jgi:hypothetical protein